MENCERDGLINESNNPSQQIIQQNVESYATNNQQNSKQHMNEITSAMVIISLCILITVTFVAFYFFYNATTPQLYGGEACIHLRNTVYLFSLCILIICGIQLILIFIGAALQHQEMIETTLLCFVTIILFFGSIGLKFTFDVLEKNEDCATLGQIISTTYLILIYGFITFLIIGFILFVLIICGGICFLIFQ